MAVFLFHIQENFIGVPAVERIVQRGWFGVELFFTLSGFLITWLLLRERNQRGSISIGRFYLRRVLRLVPAYLVVIGVTMTALWLAGTPEQLMDGINGLPYLLTYTTNFAAIVGIAFPLTLHFWSLAIEEQYYLLYPWLIGRLDGRRVIAALVVLILTTAIVRAIGFFYWPFYWPGGNGLNSLVYYFTPLRIDSILAGALAAALVASRVAREKLRQYFTGWRTTLTLVALLLAILISEGDLRNPMLYVIWLPFMYSIVALLLARLFVLDSVAPRQLLEARGVVWIGKISYGIYLVHVLVIAAVDRFADRFLSATGVAVAVRTAGAFLVTVIVAHLMYRIIEKPFLTLKSRFRA